MKKHIIAVMLIMIMALVCSLDSWGNDAIDPALFKQLTAESKWYCDQVADDLKLLWPTYDNFRTNNYGWLSFSEDVMIFSCYITARNVNRPNESRTVVAEINHRKGISRISYKTYPTAYRFP